MKFSSFFVDSMACKICVLDLRGAARPSIFSLHFFGPISVGGQLDKLHDHQVNDLINPYLIPINSCFQIPGYRNKGDKGFIHLSCSYLQILTLTSPSLLVLPTLPRTFLNILTSHSFCSFFIFVFMFITSCISSDVYLRLIENYGKIFVFNKN
ncbi:hypothetical protein BpHYR1_010497 [Brachionus plicatilis]|uniref:Uncharacterized protein n=1 Tax=Brachionus plicatilis TaxID=10195 RepID=A0A3M7SI53_BRAPC|nr:hypothetical protein BpHYR1_010497 [Brachionus plicatilis]